jgi:hypothetical protein
VLNGLAWLSFTNTMYTQSTLTIFFFSRSLLIHLK